MSLVYKLIQAFGCTPTGLMSDPDDTREGTEADARISLLWERVDNLPEKAKMDLVEVLDRFCMGWEMELAVTHSARRWEAAIVRTPVENDFPPLEKSPRNPRESHT